MNPRRPSPSSDAATGMAAFKLSPPPGVPKAVQASFLLWLTAVAAGVLETIIRIIDALAMGFASGSGGETDVTGVISGVAIRVTVYTLVVYQGFVILFDRHRSFLLLANLRSSYGLIP